MSVVGNLLATLLYLFIVVLLIRLVAEWIQVFARDWRPRGPVLVVLEAVYTVTDPPLNFIRRFVPPLRLGSIAIDLAFIILIVATTIALNVAQRL